MKRHWQCIAIAGTSLLPMASAKSTAEEGRSFPLSGVVQSIPSVPRLGVRVGPAKMTSSVYKLDDLICDTANGSEFIALQVAARGLDAISIGIFLIVLVFVIFVILKLQPTVSHPKRQPSPEPHGNDERIELTKRFTVFISYRRAESSDVTGRLYDRLAAHFGKENVFKDVDSIPLGVDFRRHIESKVSACSVVLVIIGSQWLKMTNASRLQDPNDYVRLEVETALKRNISVVPLLVQGASMPSEGDLPASLQELAFRNGIEVRSDPDFHKDVDRLIAGLLHGQGI